MSLAVAIETGDLTQLPSRRDEDWRWTDLRGLVRALPEPSPANHVDLADGPFADLNPAEANVVNGRGQTRVTVDAGASRVVALRFVATAEAGAHVARVSIDVGEGASLVLLESYEGAETGYVADAELSIVLGPGAALQRIVIANDSAAGVSVSLSDVRLDARSSLTQTVLTSGARRQRLETHVSHPGAGARVRLDGLYLLGDKRHADVTTVVTHVGVDGATDQLIKGVVAGQARGVFQGRIVVSQGADKTEARMGHHALILSDRAEVDGKPELEIWADDVVCAHGNTVGALDEEALFYARQRGIGEIEARAMLTEAFVAEVIDRIEHDGARDIARSWVVMRLGSVA